MHCLGILNHAQWLSISWNSTSKVHCRNAQLLKEGRHHHSINELIYHCIPTHGMNSKYYFFIIKKNFYALSFNFFRRTISICSLLIASVYLLCPKILLCAELQYKEQKLMKLISAVMTLFYFLTLWASWYDIFLSEIYKSIQHFWARWF